MFLLYINDIGENVLSKLKLLADDCILHKAISSIEDCHKIQNDLNAIYQCSQKWQINFNIIKCVVLKWSKSILSIPTHYHLIDRNLECVKHHTYLGVILDQTMSFSPHIEDIVSKAFKM